MTSATSVVLEITRPLPASPSAVWRALTTPDLMRRWMLIPPSTMPEAHLSLGDKVHW
jgi:uncharacterized protein YndB with AHSA1/START domain